MYDHFVRALGVFVMAGNDFNRVSPREEEGVLDQASDYVSETWNDPNSRFNRGVDSVTGEFNERTKDVDWAHLGSTLGIGAFIGLLFSNVVAQPLSQAFFGQTQGAQFAALAMTIGAVAFAWNSKTTGGFVSGLRDDLAGALGSDNVGSGRHAGLEEPSLPDDLEVG